MGRPNNTAKKPQEYTAIVEEAQQKKQTSKMYREQSMQLADDKITAAIDNTIQELNLAMDTKPVLLSDTEAIKKLTIRYFTACKQAAIIPSISGLSRSMGFSRNAIYDYCRRNPKSATAQWIEIIKDSMASILEESALRNNSNSIVSIFLLKSLYGYVDKQTIDINAAPQTPLDELPDIADVESKYLANLPKEAFEDYEIE